MPLVQLKGLIGSNCSITNFVTPRFHVDSHRGLFSKFGPNCELPQTLKCDCKKERLM